jgi:hypothetical protein
VCRDLRKRRGGEADETKGNDNLDHAADTRTRDGCLNLDPVGDNAPNFRFAPRGINIVLALVAHPDSPTEACTLRRACSNFIVDVLATNRLT